MPQEYESTNTDRLDFFFLNLVGHIVSVYTTDGCVTEGLFVSRSDDDSNAEPMILLSKARNRQSKAGGPLQATTVTSMLKIRLSDVVHLEANAVRVEAAAAGRVEPFKQVNLSEMNWAEMPLEDEGTLNSLEEEEKAWVPGKWDQFAANAQKFGVKSTYSEEQYTTRLDRSKFSKEEVELADRLSREIERTGTRGIQHRIERGEDVEVDEGTLYSDVQRQQQQQPTMSEQPKKPTTAAAAKSGAYVAPNKRVAQTSDASAAKAQGGPTGKSSPTPDTTPSATASAPASIETPQNPASPSATTSASLRVEARPFVPFSASVTAATAAAVALPRTGPVTIDDFMAHVARQIERPNVALQWNDTWQGEDEPEETSDASRMSAASQSWGQYQPSSGFGGSMQPQQMQGPTMHNHHNHHHHHHHHHTNQAHLQQHSGNVAPQGFTQNYGYASQASHPPQTMNSGGFSRSNGQQQSPTHPHPGAIPTGVRVPRPLPQGGSASTQPQQPVAAPPAAATTVTPSQPPPQPQSVAEETRRSVPLGRGGLGMRQVRHEDPQTTTPAGPTASHPPGSSVASTKKRGK